MSLVQYGTTCSIDGVNSFTSFCADLKERKTSPYKLTRNLSKYVGGHKILHGYEAYAIGSMDLTFYVYGEPTQTTNANTEAQKNASKLIVALNECVLTFSDESFEYPAGLEEYTIEDSGIDGWFIVTAKVSCVKRLPLVNQTVYGTVGEISNPGSLVSGAKITTELSSSSFDMTDMSGIRINCWDLTSGSEFCIDGLEGKVTQDGVNVFQNTDITQFPIITPGYNEIYFSKNYCNVQFYPLFYL